MNSKVTHIIWGAGNVVSIDGRYIHVDFEGEIGCRMFVYPDAFERYLKYEDAELQSEVTAKLEERRLEQQKKLEAELAAKKKAAEIAAQKQLGPVQSTDESKILRRIGKMHRPADIAGYQHKILRSNDLLPCRFQPFHMVFPSRTEYLHRLVT